MRKGIKIFLYMLLVVFIIGIVGFLIYYPAVKKMIYIDKSIKFDKSLTIYLGGGGNSVVFQSDSAVLVIDTKMGKRAKTLYNEVTSLAKNKRIIVVNTHSDLDHTGGNPLYKNATIISGKVDENYWLINNKKEGMPSVWVTDTMNLKLGDETVSIINVGQAHTWADVVIYFNNRNLLVAGDLIFNKINPFLSKGKGSSITKSIKALKNLKSAKTIIPGHNVIGGPELINSMLDYLEDMSYAAENPEKEKELIKKYRNWAKMPGIATPRFVINYFRKNK